jgi:integrase
VGDRPQEQADRGTLEEHHLRSAPRCTVRNDPLDEITVSDVAKFRAELVAKKLSDKRINNIMAVLSKPLKYAVDCEVISRSPKIGMFKVERPEIVAWDFAQYARLLATAKREGEDWYAAVCLAGEAGLRVGEVKALRWREDVDMIAKTITINQQTCNGETTTPKGRTRRTVPMTTTLHDALKRMSVIREGFVVRDLDGTAKADGQANWTMARMCRNAGLPVRYWHTLRHTFGTHTALFGVNPWRLQAWLGHKRIDETMIYVHVAEDHRREIPAPILAAGEAERDPDLRILRMLGARGIHVAAEETPEMKKAAKTAA